MLTGLLLTALLMGLGGMAHCAAMCGSACAAAFPRGLPWQALVGRALGYAALGAVAAASAGLVAQWGKQVAALRPLWMMGLLSIVLLGLVLAWSGRVPQRWDEAGRGLYRRLQGAWLHRRSRWPEALQRHLPSALPLVGGLVWALLPCGLLYAALMVAALAPHALGGAAVMLAFALPSGVGVWLAPAVLARLRGRGRPPVAPATTPVPVVWMRRAGQADDATAASVPAGDNAPAQGGAGRFAEPAPAGIGTGFDPAWAVRLSGLCLAGMAGWGLWHQLVAQWQAWCA